MVVGNAQVDPSIAIGSEGGIDVEQIERDRAKGAMNVDRETTGRKHVPIALKPFAIGQNKHSGGQRLGGCGTCAGDINDLSRRQRFWRAFFSDSLQHDWRGRPICWSIGVLSTVILIWEKVRIVAIAVAVIVPAAATGETARTETATCSESGMTLHSCMPTGDMTSSSMAAASTLGPRRGDENRGD